MCVFLCLFVFVHRHMYMHTHGYTLVQINSKIPLSSHSRVLDMHTYLHSPLLFMSILILIYRILYLSCLH
jgi:hypothetical protein